MFPNKSSIIIFILLSLTVFSAYIQADIQGKVIPQNRQEYPLEKNGNFKRMLQAISSNDKLVGASLTKTISDANSNRASKGISSLSFNSSIGTIVSQWARALKGSLALTMYLQLYGIVNVQIETYASIPSEYVTRVVENLSLGLYDANINQVSTFFSAIDNNNYEIILIFQGNNAQTIDFSSQNIQSVINQIIKDSQKYSPQASQLPPAPINSNSSTSPMNNSQQSDKNISSTSKTDIPTPPISTNNITQTQISNATINQTQATATNKNITNVTPQPQALPQNIQPVISNQSNDQIKNTSTQSVQNISVQINATQSSTSTPTSTPTPPVTQTLPVTPTSPATPTPAPQSTVTTPSQNTPNTPQSGNTQKDQPPQAASPAPAVTQPSTNLSSSTQKQPSQSPSSPPKNSSPQSNSLSYGQAQYNTALPLPLITQTTFTNTTSFTGILLTHGIPITFLKNQIFPFKGYITVPNPSGIMVNVIFTRISDQQRLAFNQYLPANVTSFKILATLNMSGTYYLSVFAGSRGYTSLTQYTVSPGFIGQIVSRSPTPLSSATLNLIGNDLWLNWTYSDVAQPTLTSIIFTQADFTVHFLLSNYETSFKVPYDQFWAFNSGITNIQISQAFSPNQSANLRTSDFSAPYIIIFNATYHQFASIKNTNKFQPIPLKIAQGNSIQIVGPAGVQLENKIFVLTPKKKFDEYFIDSNSSTQYIPKGTQVSLTINFKDSGVYILQVNEAGGEALINIPIYVGDIYPLVPDFVDLSPSYIDLAGLNQPSMIDDRRSLVLTLLNSIRSSYGVQNLYLDKNLNNLAQKYSSYQIQNNFIGHVDLQGKTPGARASAAGILEGVGQNLAMNNNLTQAQLMLQRSPAHLQNMVNPLWTRVGLGIAQDANQFYYLTQQFSSRDLTLYPLTDKQINGFQSNIVTYIVTKYSYIQGEDKLLSNRLNAYQKMAVRPYIITYLQGLGYQNVAVANIQVNYNNGNFMNLIKSGNNFDPTSTSFKQVGLSIMYINGNLEIFATYI